MLLPKYLFRQWRYGGALVSGLFSMLHDTSASLCDTLHRPILHLGRHLSCSFVFLFFFALFGVGLWVILYNVSAEFNFGCTFSDEWSGVMGVSKNARWGFITALSDGCYTQGHENDRHRDVVNFVYSQ